MFRKSVTATAVAAALIASHAERASADAFVGGLLGGFLGATIGSNVRTQPRRSQPQVSSAARQLARDIQTALNHFYFNVGTPDGVLGRQSRAGISQYQAYLGFPSTGELTEFERQVLMTAHQRALLGTPQVMQIAASHPNGLRGVLDAVRDEMLGVNQPGQVTVAAPSQAPQPGAPATAAAPAIPSFGGLGGGVAAVSLASHCNRVGLVTSANGGFATLETMGDPVFALNEQFCLARGYAIAEGEALVSQLPVAVTAQQIAEQCAGLEPMVQNHVAALSLQSRDVVIGGMTQFVLTSGLSTGDLAVTARICLSSGYQTDNLTVAIGSALILVALGETAYGELPAHHLMQGIGTAQRRELASEWYRASLPADGTRTTEVGFQPGADGRTGLILTALDRVAGGGQPQTLPVTLPMPGVMQPAQPPIQTPVETPAPAGK